MYIYIHIYIYIHLHRNAAVCGSCDGGAPLRQLRGAGWLAKPACFFNPLHFETLQTPKKISKIIKTKKRFAPDRGLEPRTTRLRAWRSTD